MARVEAQRQRTASRPPIVANNERDRDLVRRLVTDVTWWLASGEDELVLDPVNAFCRALCYQHLAGRLLRTCVGPTSNFLLLLLLLPPSYFSAPSTFPLPTPLPPPSAPPSPPSPPPRLHEHSP